jgi:hypothetical protein
MSAEMIPDDLIGHLTVESPAEDPRLNQELDQKHPISTLLSSRNIAVVVSGKVHPLTWVRIFSNSPAGNMEAEVLMGDMVVAAARANQWVNILARPDQPIASEPSLN